jgi:hypothetical protein
MNQLLMHKLLRNAIELRSIALSYVIISVKDGVTYLTKHSFVTLKRLKQEAFFLVGMLLLNSHQAQ